MVALGGPGVVDIEIGFPFIHAWIIDDEGQTYETTLKDANKYHYYGIEFCPIRGAAHVRPKRHPPHHSAQASHGRPRARGKRRGTVHHDYAERGSEGRGHGRRELQPMARLDAEPLPPRMANCPAS